jgi:Family of unknown function (DUF5317)
MALLLPIAAALVLSPLLGGSLRTLAELRLRAVWLFLAFALQVVAFPFSFVPWETDETPAKALWLASYACLGVAALLNRATRGVPIVALGLLLNLSAILANGGQMPVLPRARDAAGHSYVAEANSIADQHPVLGWLVDRWAAPDWVPLANVYSVGDVLIALGAFVLVLSAGGVTSRLPRRGLETIRDGSI